MMQETMEKRANRTVGTVSYTHLIAGVGIRAEDHLAAACEHFSCKLVDNRLMRRYINAAVFFCTSQSE